MDRVPLKQVAKMLIRWRVALALAALAVGAPVDAAVASRPANPHALSAMTLLERVLKAHERLGPCYIEHSYRSGYSQVPPLKTWLRRNDGRHFVMSREMRSDETLIYYVNGRQRVTYDPGRNTFRRDRLGSDDMADAPVSSFLYGFRDALSDPASRPRFARTHVEPITFQGIPCYRLVWDPKSPTGAPLPDPPNAPPGAGGRFIAPFRVLVVGRKDYLVRKLVQDLPTTEKESVEVFTYQFKSRPYPASTFVFKPPPGAKEEVLRYVD